MIKLLLFPMLCLGSFVGLAQDTPQAKFKIGIGASLVIPAGNLLDRTAGGGIDLLALYRLSEKVNFSGDAGFITLPGKSILPATGVVPVRLGIRFFPVPNVYLGAKAGLGIYTIVKESSTFLAGSVGAGYNFNNHFDAGISYDGYNNSERSFGYVGIRLGYTFGK
jgi:hypothetical protein